ncbi:MAG: hypothetical protein JXA54_10690 [Candidatus Heimdallarchaeota archaeon]|nr:hypothetical protein [Candidatus Heimdallarchaeota archaeon]
MITKKEHELEENARAIWGEKCQACGKKSELKISFEKEKNYLVIIMECSVCGFMLFMGEDKKYRWMLRE